MKFIEALADIHLWTPGRVHPIHGSGSYRPVVTLAGNHYSTQLLFHQPIYPGQNATVRMRFVCPQAADYLYPGLEFSLNEGTESVGFAVVVSTVWELEPRTKKTNT